MIFMDYKALQMSDLFQADSIVELIDLNKLDYELR